MFYEIFSSKDRKIMMWDRECLEDLIGCFSIDEYYEMQDYLDNNPLSPERVGDCVATEDFGCLVYEYMKRRFHELIEVGHQTEIRAFFEALMEWYSENSYFSELERQRLMALQGQKQNPPERLHTILYNNVEGVWRNNIGD